MYSWQFSKKISLPKNDSHLEFSPKMQKHKFPSISITVRDRAISSKFSTHRVSQQSTLANLVQVLEQNSCFPLGGHYACQCVLFLVSILNKITCNLKNIALREFCIHMLFSYFWVSYNIVKFQTCSSLHS